MKIPFYTLPKAERRRILDKMEKLTTNAEYSYSEYQRYLNLAEHCKFQLDNRRKELADIREKYDFN